MNKHTFHVTTQNMMILISLQLLAVVISITSELLGYLKKLRTLSCHEILQ